MAATAKDRAAEFRDKAHQEGRRQLATWVSGTALDNLDAIAKEHNNTRTAVLNAILEQPRRPQSLPTLPAPPKHIAILEQLEQMRRDAIIRAIDDRMGIGAHLPLTSALFKLFRELYACLPPSFIDPRTPGLAPFGLVAPKHGATPVELHVELNIRVEWFAIVALPVRDYGYGIIGYRIDPNARREVGGGGPRGVGEAVTAYFRMLAIAAWPELKVSHEALHNHLLELVCLNGPQMRYHLDASHQRERTLSKVKALKWPLPVCMAPEQPVDLPADDSRVKTLEQMIGRAVEVGKFGAVDAVDAAGKVDKMQEHDQL
jgi:hypothetical protein